MPHVTFSLFRIARCCFLFRLHLHVFSLPHTCHKPCFCSTTVVLRLFYHVSLGLCKLLMEDKQQIVRCPPKKRFISILTCNPTTPKNPSKKPVEDVHLSNTANDQTVFGTSKTGLHCLGQALVAQVHIPALEVTCFRGISMTFLLRKMEVRTNLTPAFVWEPDVLYMKL